MYIGDRKEREEHMDNLERQMEDQRQQIRRTLDRMEGSSRRRTVLEKLRSNLPSFPGRIPARGTGQDGQDGPRPPESPGTTQRTPTDAVAGRESGTEQSWWLRMFGG
jgi:hypothetical protein